MSYKDIRSDVTKINEIKDKIIDVKNIQNENKNSIENCKSTIHDLAIQYDLEIPQNLKTCNEQADIINDNITWEDDLFINNNFDTLEKEIKKEIYKNPEILPKLNSLDITIVVLAGVVATIIDFLVVKIPKDVKYLNKFKQEGSQFTSYLRSLGINKDGELKGFLKWLEKKCKVPYDMSLNKNIQGFGTRTHRLLNLGHDPLLGLIFGIFDILNGSMTCFDTTGNIHIINTYDLTNEKKLFAPLLWIGHIVSDICTSMGIPIPGWGFTQLLQFGSIGQNDRTIADIARYMYLKGYDLRHLITMSTSVATMEIIVRAYHYITLLNRKEDLDDGLISSISQKEIKEMQQNLKLHKMLFLSNALASGGNALKIFVKYQGNPLALNAPQWLNFLRESITISKAITRDKTVEKIIRNRNRINEEWENIKNINIDYKE